MDSAQGGTDRMRRRWRRFLAFLIAEAIAYFLIALAFLFDVMDRVTFVVVFMTVTLIGSYRTFGFVRSWRNAKNDAERSDEDS